MNCKLNCTRKTLHSDFSVQHDVHCFLRKTKVRPLGKRTVKIMGPVVLKCICESKKVWS